jgi:Protein of unknown function (DUF3078)
MLKTVQGFLFFMFLCFFFQAKAQNPDSVKVDTAKLNKYRVDPGHNALPQIYRPIQIQEQQLPVSMLDYKVNYWHRSLIFGLNFSQSAFTSNYSAGGISSIALGSNLDYKAEYNKKPLDFTSETNLQYGASKNQGQGSRKTNDRIFFDNKIATDISKHWSFFGSLTFESQFSAGYNYLNPDGTNAQNPYIISDFMSPGYLTESLGFEYKPVKYFDMRFGTGTARQTFMLDTTIYKNVSGNYGVPIDHKIFNQLAVQVVAEIDKDLTKTIHINARYAIFVPYIQPLAYTSHRIDATLTAKVTRLIAMTVNATMLYDKTSSASIQGTEGLALGVMYKFP